MLPRLPFSLSSAAGLVSTMAFAVLAVSVVGCARQPVYEGPELSAFEQQQHERCVSLLRTAWHGAPVRFTSAERGASGLDYVWVNVDVDDDHDDIERRSAKGTQHAGHCQFDQGSDVVHVHSYALDARQAASARDVASGADTGADKANTSYRYFTASAHETGLLATQGGPNPQ